MKKTCLLSVLVFAAVACADRGPVASAVYPGADWIIKTPGEMGLDADKLKQLADYAGGSGCVVRHGCMVYTWGQYDRRKDVASAAKPVYTHLLMKAIEDGRIGGLEEPVMKVEPRLGQINAAMGFKDRRITWRHLANQVSCYGSEEAPGTAYDYNDHNMALLFDALMLKVYGSTWETVDHDVLRPLLVDVMQCQDEPTFMAFGTGDRPGRLGISCRDFARFGLLYLREGRWRDRRLLDVNTARMAVKTPLPLSIPRTRGKTAEMIPQQRSIGGGGNQCDHQGCYSFAWWINAVTRQGRRNWPDAASDTFGCFGHGDIRAVVVLPSLDIVVSWNDARLQGSEKVNHALKLLADAVVDAGETPPDPIVADPENPQWLRRKDRGGFFMCGPGDPEDFLYRGTLRPDGTRDGDQMAMIEKLSGTGANCIYLMAIRSHGGDGDRTHNPFVNNNPAKGINSKVFAQWQEWFTAMDRAGIVIFFFIYDDSARIWRTGDRVGSEEAEFLRALVEAFKHHDNLIWCVAEEYQEAFSAARVKAIAAVIRNADENRHPVAVHKLNGLHFEELADCPDIDQFAIQYNVADSEMLHAGVVEAWRRAAGRYNLNLAEAADWGTGAEARLKNWAVAMGGAYVMIFGMDIATTPISDLEDCGRLVRFFESIDLRGMGPRDDLAFSDTKYVLANPGRRYIAYSSSLQTAMGIKDFPAGTWDLFWFDCASGKEHMQKNVRAAAGNCAWRTPSGMGSEVALYVKRTD